MFDSLCPLASHFFEFDVNLHSVDSIDDPVQVAVRKNLLAYSGSGGIEDSPLHDLDYLRSVLRGVKRTCPTGNETVQH